MHTCSNNSNNTTKLIDIDGLQPQRVLSEIKCSKFGVKSYNGPPLALMKNEIICYFLLFILFIRKLFKYFMHNIKIIILDTLVFFYFIER